MKKKKVEPLEADLFTQLILTDNNVALIYLTKKLNEVISYINDESKTAGTTVPKKGKKEKKL